MPPPSVPMENVGRVTRSVSARNLSSRPATGKRPMTSSTVRSSEMTETSYRSRFIVTVRVRPLAPHEHLAPCQPHQVTLTDTLTRPRTALGIPSADHHDSSALPLSTCTVLDDKILVFDPSAARQARYKKGNTTASKEMKYAFDRVLSERASQSQVFEATTKPLIDGVLDGYNATVFAYGATGAGKTHTMLGTPTDPGVMVLSMSELFERIRQSSQERAIQVTLTYFEIYNEMIRDLLEPSGPLELREDDQARRITISGLSEHYPESVHDVMQLLRRGNANRIMSPTQANATSSRSHAVLQIQVQQRERTANTSAEIACATLSLIDLAGSERASVTSNRGERIREGANINRSLLALGNANSHLYFIQLGNCINALCDPKSASIHIPYRDSKLTRLLKYSLGGNCRTVMIAAVSPSLQHYEDTHNTLVYANRAKNIKTKVARNSVQVQYHVKQYMQIISELRLEIEELKQQLQHQHTTVAIPMEDELDKKEPPNQEIIDPVPIQQSSILLDELQSQIHNIQSEWQLFESEQVAVSEQILLNEMLLDQLNYWPSTETVEQCKLDHSQTLASLQNQLTDIYAAIDRHENQLFQLLRPLSLTAMHQLSLDHAVSLASLRVQQWRQEKYSEALQRVLAIQREWCKVLMMAPIEKSVELMERLEQLVMRKESKSNNSSNSINSNNAIVINLSNTNLPGSAITNSVNQVNTNASTPFKQQSHSNTPLQFYKDANQRSLLSMRLFGPLTGVKDALTSWRSSTGTTPNNKMTLTRSQSAMKLMSTNSFLEEGPLTMPRQKRWRQVSADGCLQGSQKTFQEMDSKDPITVDLHAIDLPNRRLFETENKPESQEKIVNSQPSDSNNMKQEQVKSQMKEHCKPPRVRNISTVRKSMTSSTPTLPIAARTRTASSASLSSASLAKKPLSESGVRARRMSLSDATLSPNGAHSTSNTSNVVTNAMTNATRPRRASATPQKSSTALDASLQRLQSALRKLPTSKPLLSTTMKPPASLTSTPKRLANNNNNQSSPSPLRSAPGLTNALNWHKSPLLVRRTDLKSNVVSNKK